MEPWQALGPGNPGRPGTWEATCVTPDSDTGPPPLLQTHQDPAVHKQPVGEKRNNGPAKPWAPLISLPAFHPARILPKSKLSRLPADSGSAE